jgi:hypothetical protein
VHGIEWRTFYLLLLGCMLVGFTALWNPLRLLLLPLIYFGPWAVFRRAGKHDPQWHVVYPAARRNRVIFYAGADPRKPDPAPARRVLFERPRINA